MSKNTNQITGSLSKNLTDLIDKLLVEDANESNRELLVDTPIVTKSKSTNKTSETNEVQKKVTPIEVPNAFEASSLNKVRLINVNKTVSKILTDIFEEIKNMNEEGYDYLEIDPYSEEWDDLLKNVRQETFDKVWTRVLDYLLAKGFGIEVETLETEDEGESTFIIEW